MTQHNTAYDIDNEQLIAAFKVAAGNARTDKSLQTLQQEQYLQGILLARLEGVKPLLNRDDVVRFKRPEGALPAKASIVHRAFYLGGNRWGLTFIGDAGHSIFPAEMYEHVHESYPSNGRTYSER